MSSRGIAIVLTTRGNYAKMGSTLCAAKAIPSLEVKIVVGGALLRDDYGVTSSIIEDDGHAIDAKLDYILGDHGLEDVAKSAGRCTMEMGSILARLKPDIVMVIADRYEALSIAHAALCQNIAIAHLEGGEVSGSIDERIRHAITKLANVHFPANQAAAERIRRLGEPPERIHVVGTPSLDLLRHADLDETAALALALKRDGVGAEISLDDDFVVVSQHPVVTEYADAARQFAETAKAVCALAMPAFWIGPNDEAGADAFGPVREALQANRQAPPVRFIGGLGLIDYAVLLRRARCLIGNSSSGLREGAYLGVPAVNIGSRQQGRQQGANVVDVEHECDAIVAATRRQIEAGRYPSDPIYGDGRAGEKIARILAETPLGVEKTITF